MYKELESDIKEFSRPDHGYLIEWAQQGVFMLNATLTVRAHMANSHKKIGWQKFTDNVISILNEQKKDIVFALWGGFAQTKGKVRFYFFNFVFLFIILKRHFFFIFLFFFS